MKTITILLLLAASAFSQTPGIVGVYESTSTYYIGFTAPSFLSHSTVWQWPAADSAGCWYSNGAGVISINACGPATPSGSVQFNNGSGGFGGSANFLWNNTTSSLDIAGGIVTSGNAWNAISSSVDGIYMRGYNVAQSGNNLNGGYIALSPVTYNPYDSPNPCYDQWGNLVTQPLPLPGLSAFLPNSTIMWVGTSPVMPPSCGTPFPVEDIYGLNINSYLFALGGLATSNPYYNSINALLGGVTAISFTAGGLYNTGTVTACCGTLTTPTYIGGYMQSGHSAGPPAYGTIATVNNPITAGDGLEQGTFYWDDTLACMNVYNGTSWSCLGSGGGGSTPPAGANTQVQYNNSGAFGASPNFVWNNSTLLLSITGTVGASVGFDTTSTATNAIQAPSGGVYGTWLTASDSIFWLEEATPPLSGAGQARVYADSTAHVLKISENGGAYTSLGGGGSAIGAANQVQYSGGSGAFAASSNFTFNPSTQLLTVTASGALTAGIAVATGYIQSATGFLSVSCTAYNCFQPVNGSGNIVGGMVGLNFTASNYVQTGQWTGAVGSTTPTLSSGDSFNVGTLSWNVTSACEAVYNGSHFTCLASGSGGTPGGSNTNVQFNNSAAFGGSSNFTWNNTTQLLTVVATSATVAGIGVSNGYVQADAGFLATSGVATKYNSIQAPSGGVSGLSFTANNYVQTGNYSATLGTGPTATTGDSFHAGAMSWSTSSVCEAVYTGTAWVCIGGAGVASINGITGALTLAGTTNEITLTPSGTTITFSTPQQIATTSNVTFGTVSSTGTIQSSSSGSAIAFQTSSPFNFQVNGNGYISSGGTSGGLNVSGNTNPNSIQTVGGFNAGAGGGGSGVYEVNGVVVINNAQQFIGTAVNVSGVVQSQVTGCGSGNPSFQTSNTKFSVDGCGNISYTGSINGSLATFSSAVTMNGGFLTASGTNSNLYIGTGNFYDHTTGGASTGASCSGITDGWMAITSDDYIIVCLGGNRFRAAIVSY